MDVLDVRADHRFEMTDLQPVPHLPPALDTKPGATNKQLLSAVGRILYQTRLTANDLAKIHYLIVHRKYSLLLYYFLDYR